MKFHSATSIFPLLEGEEFEKFKKDVRMYGQREEIALLGGLVLDGRNRYRACVELGLVPKTRELPAGTDPVAYVLSANLHRRHLTPNQIAMCAACARALRQKLDQSAKRRQRKAGKPGWGRGRPRRRRTDGRHPDLFNWAEQQGGGE
jgi:hypothetical protein